MSNHQFNRVLVSKEAGVQFPYISIRGGRRSLEPSGPSPSVAPVALVADDVVGDGAVGELLAVVELVGLAAAHAVQRKVSRAVSSPENKEAVMLKLLGGFCP